MVSIPDDRRGAVSKDAFVTLRLVRKYPLGTVPSMLAVLACCVAMLPIGSVSAAPSRPAGMSARAMPILRSYRVGEHSGYDRVVFVFSRGLPDWRAQYVKRVREDASGKPVRLQGRAFLLVTLMGVDWSVQHMPAEPTLTPHFAVLRQLKPAGVFEAYYSFGLGLGYRTTYRFFTLRHPDRLVLDLHRRR